MSKNAGMCARERRREARAKFCGVSFRRFLVNAGRHVVSGVFVENAGRCTPENGVFFCSVISPKKSYLGPIFRTEGSIL